MITTNDKTDGRAPPSSVTSPHEELGTNQGRALHPLMQWQWLRQVYCDGLQLQVGERCPRPFECEGPWKKAW